MQANLTLNKFRIRDTTVNVIIPPNDLARLMYYLNCVNSVLNFPNLTPYTDYHNYYLYNHEINNIIYYAKLFNPNQMTSIRAFVLDENISISNRFFEITDEVYCIHANEKFVIGGSVVKISKVMVYKSDWAAFFYFLPLQRLTNPALIYSQNYNNFSNYNNYNSAVDDCLCSCNIF